MSKIGKGMAVVGVWIGAGIMSFSPAAAGHLIEIVGVAAVATYFIAMSL